MEQPVGNSGDLTVRRRSILRYVGILGATPAFAALLSACGGAVATPTPPTAPAAASAAPVAATSPASASARPSAAASTASGSAAPSAAASSGAAAGAGGRGGTIKIAMNGSPATIDIHSTGAANTGTVGWHIWEPLFAVDSKFGIVPMLAESLDTSADGLTATLKLRRGVKFHNGQELIADDVIASITRWGSISGLGKPLVEAIAEMKATDPYTVTISLKSPYGSMIAALTQNNSGCAIHPKSVMAATGTNKLEQFIGTGPYQFVESLPDRYIRVKRFDGYVGLSGEPQGFGGRKFAYADEIQFIPVADRAAQLAGLQTGEFHLLESVPSDQYDILKGDATLRATILPPSSYQTLMLNWNSKVTGNLKLRQAIQAALNHEPILQASYGAGFYRLGHELMLKETPWASPAGAPLYNRNNAATAKQLLQEAGYAGAPLRFATTKDNPGGDVMRAQLQAAGFTIEPLVMDAATLSSTINGLKDTWELSSTSFGLKPDPTQLTFLQLSKWGGAWSTPETEKLVLDLRQKSGFEARKAIFDQVQQRFYDEVGLIKTGDILSPGVYSAKLKGDVLQNIMGINLWNLWLEK